MNLIQTIYGNQYDELNKKGYDTDKGRLYGNLLISATIFIILITLFILMNLINDDFSDDVTKFFKNIFGRTSGKMIGQFIAIPVLLAIYAPIALIFGNKKAYKKSYELYQNASNEVRDAKLLKGLSIFIISLLTLLVIAIGSLFF